MVWLLIVVIAFVILSLKNNFTYDYCPKCESHVRSGAPRCTSCGTSISSV